MTERLNEGSDKVDWSPEAQAARLALGIVVNSPARGELYVLEKPVNKWSRNLHNI